MLLLLLLLISCAPIRCMELYGDIPLKQIPELEIATQQDPNNNNTNDLALNGDAPSPLASVTLQNVWTTWTMLEATRTFNQYPQFKKQAYDVILDDIIDNHHQDIFNEYYYNIQPRHDRRTCVVLPDQKYELFIQHNIDAYLENRALTTSAKQEITDVLTQHERIKAVIQAQNKGVCFCTTATGCISGTLIAEALCCIFGCP
ncbi:MAG: hypothetical protein WCE21_01060 [Candidatus Babeliales bacterium]